MCYTCLESNGACRRRVKRTKIFKGGFHTWLKTCQKLIIINMGLEIKIFLCSVLNEVSQKKLLKKYEERKKNQNGCLRNGLKHLKYYMISRCHSGVEIYQN